MEIDKTSIEQFFGAASPLGRAPEFGGRPYEPRPQQQQMAVAVAEHLKTGKHLLVEAPTGVGKTYAYLLPVLKFAEETGQPVVISTHTISLQEQIIDKDLPVLQGILESEYKAAIAKGRANYICLRRLNAAANQNQDFLPSEDLVPELDRIYLWSEKTEDGSLSSLDFEPRYQLWQSICCETGNCLNAKCRYSRRCFFLKARRRLSEAQVIIANHALFFTDLAMKFDTNSEEGGILPSYGAVILDEGHCIEDAAAQHLGIHLSEYMLRRILHRLYNPERNRGLLVDVMYTEARLAVIDTLERSGHFFSRISDWVSQQNKDPLRYSSPGHIPNMVSESLENVEDKVGLVLKNEDDEDRATELRSLHERLHEFRHGLHVFLEMAAENHVYWFESQGRDSRKLNLNGVPVEVAPLLQEYLFSKNFTTIVTSATLAVRGRMDYFQQRIGAVDASSLILDSPFDFAEQVNLYIPGDMPNPNDTRLFVPAACEHIQNFVQQTNGKAFVLFTSYQMMRQAATELADFFLESGLKLYVQGDGLPRSLMLQAFREDVHSVIFGTASFWTGVDVPGEALSNVIIVKLPFAVPDHPLIAARQELIEKRGGRAFRDYALPEAVLKFRQGFGRLIRSRDDNGIVVVLDNRIVRTSYGRAFLDSIPNCKREIF